jgi:hypothetical protein
VRLGTCVALEIALVLGAGGAAYVGIDHAVEHGSDYLATRAAAASRHDVTMPRVDLPESLPAGRLPVVPPRLPNNVYGAHDDDLLAPLAAAPVARMKLNHGGTSLSLRIDFANGARAAFKPEQIHPQSDPRREIAAYRIDRLLGIGRVPPAKEATFAVKDLLDAAAPGFRAYYTARIGDEAILRGGVVHGELSWWIPEIKLAKLGRHRIDEREGRLLWTTYLQLGVRIPPEHRSMLEQISALVLFDVLIDNADRWSGANTRMSPEGDVLYFMDNTLSFSLAKFGHEANVAAMRRIQVFPRGLVRRIRELTYEQLVATLALGPETKLGRLLHPDEIRAIIARRDNMLRYIDQLIETHGETAVLAFP